jgi:arginine utilization regulatory protein
MEFKGNIRELENLIYTVMSAKNKRDYLLTPNDFQQFVKTPMGIVHKFSKKNLNEYLYSMEKQKILVTLATAQKNITRTAKILGISRQNLQYRLKKLEIDL